MWWTFCWRERESTTKGRKLSSTSAQCAKNRPVTDRIWDGIWFGITPNQSTNPVLSTVAKSSKTNSLLDNISTRNSAWTNRHLATFYSILISNPNEIQINYYEIIGKFCLKLGRIWDNSPFFLSNKPIFAKGKSLIFFA